jgi:hypothetical protein
MLSSCLFSSLLLVGQASVLYSDCDLETNPWCSDSKPFDQGAKGFELIYAGGKAPGLGDG